MRGSRSLHLCSMLGIWALLYRRSSAVDIGPNIKGSPDSRVPYAYRYFIGPRDHHHHLALNYTENGIHFVA